MFLSILFLPVVSPIIYGFYLLYVPFYLSGVFNAAKNYNNGLIWKYLAYLSVILGTLICTQELLQVTDMVIVMKSLILK